MSVRHPVVAAESLKQRARLRDDDNFLAFKTSPCRIISFFVFYLLLGYAALTIFTVGNDTSLKLHPGNQSDRDTITC